LPYINGYLNGYLRFGEALWHFQRKNGQIGG
jgi:hypothetical protein